MRIFVLKYFWLTFWFIVIQVTSGMAVYATDKLFGYLFIIIVCGIYAVNIIKKENENV